MTLTITGKRSERLTEVFARLLGDLRGTYNFGTVKIIDRDDDTVTLSVEAVQV